MSDKQKQIEEISFIVIDNKTGKEADIGKIALKEDWAKGLMYCDMEGFALLQDGNLILMDECGRYEYCPSGRFTVVPENAVVLTDKKDIQQYEWSKLVDKMGVIEFGKKVLKDTAEKFAERAKEEAFVVFMGEPIIRASTIDEICEEIEEGKV